MPITKEKMQELERDGTIRLFMYGDSWCATYWDFYNLQESSAGFGDTQLEAVNALLEECPL